LIFLGVKQRVDIRCDLGAFVGLFLPEPSEVLFPTTMSSQDFVVLRKRLGGFGEAVKTFPLAHILASNDDTEANIEVKLIKRVKKVLNVFLVQVCYVYMDVSYVQ
jgi:hypothetical protein